MTENNPDVQFTHIQYMNSGDVSIGTKDRVVGYNAIAITLREKNRGANFELDKQDKHSLIEIARTTIEEYVRHGKIPTIDDRKLSAAVKADCGAFVTLKKGGELRGCIGRFDATEPLYKIVQTMAIAASTQDYRFHPVASEELGKIVIEISVLTPLRKIKSIDEIVMGKNGIYIRKGSSSGTFLPQVATETGWSKEEFLGHCAQDKAGIGWDGWRNAELFIYESLIFDENEFKKK
jgi:AmmeMemoRadiSam system protein A